MTPWLAASRHDAEATFEVAKRPAWSFAERYGIGRTSVARLRREWREPKPQESTVHPVVNYVPEGRKINYLDTPRRFEGLNTGRQLLGRNAVTIVPSSKWAIRY